MYEVLTMKTIAQELNNRTFTDYYYRLMLLSRSVFEWSGLPNGIDEKWIERFLFNEGKCVFFKDKNKGFMVMKFNEYGGLNPYDEPIQVQAYGTNYEGETLENNENCVIIRNNDEMIPTQPTIELYAMKLSELSRTIDINVNAQKTPTLILCSEKQRMSLKQVYKQWNGYEPVIYGSKDMDIEGMKSLKTDAPIVFDKLQLQKHAVWNECMTFLGLGNANQDKKERLVANEVEANNEQIEMSANIFLKSRQRACELINKMFELNVSVKIRECQKPNLEVLEGGIKDDSKIHNVS